MNSEEISLYPDGCSDGALCNDICGDRSTRPYHT